MLVNLLELPMSLACELIHYCAENNIDYENCVKIVSTMHATPVPDINWSLDIPDEAWSYILLKL